MLVMLIQFIASTSILLFMCAVTNHLFFGKSYKATLTSRTYFAAISFWSLWRLLEADFISGVIIFALIILMGEDIEERTKS
jgi:hypothetical protein